MAISDIIIAGKVCGFVMVVYQRLFKNKTKMLSQHLLSILIYSFKIVSSYIGPLAAEYFNLTENYIESAVVNGLLFCLLTIIFYLIIPIMENYWTVSLKALTDNTDKLKELHQQIREAQDKLHKTLQRIN